jgi:23S rRNA (cytosine1962-C5)-methyltransferase
VEERRVRVASQIVDRPNTLCPPGARVEIDLADDEPMPMPLEARSGRWQAWVDEPACFGGVLQLATDAGGELAFRVEERERGLARLALSGPECSTHMLCRVLSEAGMPVVGDLLGGGLAKPGGPAISQGADALTHAPDDPPWPEAESPGSPLVFAVSEEAARAIGRGHPWILSDLASDAAEAFRPGSLVRVESRVGARLGWAWAEGDPHLAARIAALGDIEAREVDSVESRVARALGRRRALLTPAGASGATDCHRLIHAEADGLPGLFVDRLGPLLRVLVKGRVSDEFRERALAALRTQLPVTPQGADWSVLELLHVRPTGAAVGFDRVRWIEGDPHALIEAGVEIFGAGFWVEERGLRFAVDPGWDAPRRTRPGFGLFPDQRENRARVAALAARGGRWLNLFAHTGAFSVALLAAGAERVVSVDLSGPYLERLEANLGANRERGVEAGRHTCVRLEVRRYLEALDPGERFAGIVLDPPTAAAAGRRFWSLRRDLEPLLQMSIDRLEAGGTLLVTQNQRGAPLGLDTILERLAARAGRRIESLREAGPGIDHPRLPEFPEGDAFEGWMLTVE